MNRKLLTFLIGFTCSISAVSVTQIATKYQIFCQEAASNDRLFKQFRSHPECRGMVDNVRHEMGEGMAMVDTIVEKYPHLLTKLDKIRLEDRLGEPVSYQYPFVGYFCPTTLRYIKIAGDLEKLFPNLATFRILEIGGGYGGQCKVLSDLFGFVKYSIIDLPECLPLIAKFLNAQQVKNVQTLFRQEEKEEYDLFISNYAFSEIDREEQLFYLNQFISSIPRGYITYNQVSPYHGLTSLTAEEVVAFLTKNGREIVTQPETPSTGDSTVIIWYPK